MLVVVAGLIWNEGKVLIAQRRLGDTGAGLWEFPGGKIQKGESPEQALVRELREEMAIEVEVGSIVDALPIPVQGGEGLLLLYHCQHRAGEPRALECAAFQWCGLEELPLEAFLPADQEFVRRMGV